MSQSQIQFIQHEIAVWGADHIESLLDRGFEPVQLTDSNGSIRWTWRLPATPVQTFEQRAAVNAQ